MDASRKIPRNEAGLRALFRFLLCVILVKASVERMLRRAREERQREREREGMSRCSSSKAAAGKSASTTSGRRWWRRTTSSVA